MIQHEISSASTSAVTVAFQDGQPRSEEYQVSEEPPDGGIVAWTQVAMGHLVMFNTWGYITS